MSSDIISCLQLNKIDGGSKIIVAKEVNGCDSSFLISCILGQCIKLKSPLVLISLNNAVSHFQNVGLKMNYNLQKYIDIGLISFINLGLEIVNNLLGNQCASIDSIISKTSKIISDMQEKHANVNIVIDGVCHLFDLGFKLKDVNNFCNVMIGFVRKSSDSFFLCHCNVASDSDSSYVLSNLLSHKASTVVEVNSLSSGLSADVSGHITIKYPGQKYEDEHMFVLNPASTQYLFKLFDRGVKLFAPGTV